MIAGEGTQVSAIPYAAILRRADKRHTWHMELLGRLCATDEQLLLQTPFQIVIASVLVDPHCVFPDDDRSTHEKQIQCWREG
jgi:hypothetical protein